MTKRNFKDEILNLKERDEFANGIFESTRLDNLLCFINMAKTDNNSTFTELYKYIPIATVACFESFSRTSIKSLIDKGEPYSVNITKFNGQNNLKFDFEIVKDLQKNSFTIGELISHILPCNNLTEFNSNISKVLGEDLLESLKNYKPHLGNDLNLTYTNKFKENFNGIIKSIVRLFELRHIFCHETGLIEISRETIEIDFLNAKMFLDFASGFICSKLYDNWGLTIAEKLEIKNQEYINANIEFEQKINIIKKENSKLSDDKKDFEMKFKSTINTWKKHSHNKAMLKSCYTPSGIWARFIYIESIIKDMKILFEDISLNKNNK